LSLAAAWEIRFSKVIVTNGSYELRDPEILYEANFGIKNDPLRQKKRSIGRYFFEIQ
jgi:hypothetical protein